MTYLSSMNFRKWLCAIVVFPGLALISSQLSGAFLLGGALSIMAFMRYLLTRDAKQLYERRSSSS